MKHDVQRFTGAGVLLLALITLTGGCAGTRPDLEGAWECLQPAPQPGQPPVVKVLVDGHFAFGAGSVDGGAPRAGGGTYAQTGGAYTETITYHWAKALVGQVITFECVVEEGLWHHRGLFVADGERFQIDEVWRRVGEPAPTR